MTATLTPARNPKTSTVQQDYTAARKNLDKLKADRLDTAGKLSVARSRPKAGALTPEARAMVVGLAPTPAVKTYDPAEAAALQNELANIDRAIGAQEVIVRDRHRAMSLAACRAVGPEHRELLQRIADAGKALIVATEAERQFRDELAANNIEILGPIDGAPIFPLEVAVRVKAYIGRLADAK